jgi:hypothetical protein
MLALGVGLSDMCGFVLVNSLLLASSGTRPPARKRVALRCRVAQAETKRVMVVLRRKATVG